MDTIGAEGAHLLIHRFKMRLRTPTFSGIQSHSLEVILSNLQGFLHLPIYFFGNLTDVVLAKLHLASLCGHEFLEI